MKNITLILIAQLLFSIGLMAQNPSTIPYQNVLQASNADSIIAQSRVQNSFVRQSIVELIESTQRPQSDIGSHAISGFTSTQVESDQYEWHDGDWLKTSNILSSYDQNGNMIVQLVSREINNIIYPDTKTTHTFDRNNNKTQLMTQKWDTTKSDWQTTYQVDYTYYENGRLLSEIKSRREFDRFYKYEQEFFSYNEANKLTSTKSIWLTLDNTWAGYKEIINYDSQNRITEHKYYYSSGGNRWAPKRKRSYTYKDATEYVITEHDWTAGKWVIQGFRFQITLNEDGQIFKNVNEQLQEDRTWHILYRDLYQYDSKGNNTEWLLENYNETDSIASWTTTAKFSYAYSDAGQLTQLILFLPSHTEIDEWDKVEDLTFEYDDRGLLTKATTFYNLIDKIYYSGERNQFKYDFQGNLSDSHYENWVYTDWEKTNRMQSSLNENGLIEESISQIWNGIEWINAERATFTYKSTVSNEDTQPADLNFTLNHYPNPATETSNISFDLAQPADISLELYDLLGRRIKSIMERQLPAGGHSVQVELSDLPNGTYFYRLSAGDEVQSAKVLVMN